MQAKIPELEALFALPDDKRKVGPFRLLPALGSGGFAPVWLAEESYGGRTIRRAAVKLFVLGPNRDAVIDEAQAVCHVEHPNVVRFFTLAIDEERGVMGLAMEYVDGVSVDHKLNDHGGALPLLEAIAIGIAVSSALEAVHRTGLVHRDVKPGNVVNAAGIYKLIDFGVALGARERVRPERREITILDDLPLALAGSKVSEVLRTDGGASYLCGTLGYICPHCVRGGRPTTAACDLYSLGALLFQCMSGVLPCVAAAKLDGATGLSGEVLDGRRAAPSLLTVLPDAPKAVVDIVDALLCPDPKKRPVSAGLVAVALEQSRIATRVLVPATPVPIRAVHPATPKPMVATASPTPARSKRGRSIGIAVAASALASGVAGVIVFAYAGTTDDTIEQPIVETRSSVLAIDSGDLIDPTIATARADIERGNYSSAIDALVPLVERFPRRADLHELLEMAYTGTKDAPAAMREAELWLDTDPNAADNLRLLEHVRNAALASSATDSAFNLLEERLGAAGTDILYDVGWLTSGQLYPTAAARARASLAKPSTRAGASKALLTLLEFRDAKTCEEKHGLLNRVFEYGDWRFLALLELYVPTSGCGSLKQQDCFPCMRSDRALKDAIIAIRARHPGQADD